MAYTTIDDPSVYFQTFDYVGSLVQYTGMPGPGTTPCPGHPHTADLREFTMHGNSDIVPDLSYTKALETTSGIAEYGLFNATGHGASWVNRSTDAVNGNHNDVVVAYSDDSWTTSDGPWHGHGLNMSGTPYTNMVWYGSDSRGVLGDQATTGQGTGYGSGRLASYLAWWGSSIDVNTTSKFSRFSYSHGDSNPANYTYPKDSIEHGMGVKPEFFMIKSKRASQRWVIYHKDMHTTPAQKYLRGDDDGTLLDNSANFDDKEPDTTTVYFGEQTTSPQTGYTNVGPGSGHSGHWFFGWAGVQGYSKFGKYTGNGETVNGPFVHLGFQPSYIIIKNVDSTGHWYEYTDAASHVSNTIEVDPYQVSNPNKNPQWADTQDHEVDNTDLGINMLSNGFKVESGSSNTAINGDGDTMIYAAWAIVPFVTSTGIAGPGS